MVKQVSRKDWIVLEDIANGYPGLTAGSGKHLLEACAITLYRANHRVGVELQLTGVSTKGKKLFWNKLFTTQLDRTWKDQIEATQYAAACISILLAIRYSTYTVIERSVIGTGFDYWLGNETETKDVFDKKARLEVSGIFSGDDRSINERVRIKTRQTNQSRNTSLPAFVSVVEFSKPESKFVIHK